MNKKGKTQNGITLIALVITIIVMLILVAVTISMAINGGLFEYAGKAVGDTQNSINAEQQLANGKIKIDGKWYASIDDYINNTPIAQSITIEETLKLEIAADYDVATAPVTGQLTATLNEIEGTVTWTIDNEAVAKVSNTGLVTAVAAGTAKITASVTFEGETYKDECTVTVEAAKTTISTTDSYVGCYADIDGDEVVDGVIYADLTFGVSGTYDSFDYSKEAVTTGLKEYYVSGTADGKFGNGKNVITAVEGSTGTDRFYVMALSNVTTTDYSTFYWYYDAYGDMSDYADATSTAFGTGETNTAKIKGYWDAKTPYGEQNARDLWGQVEANDDWFVPSIGEWAAFADAFDVTSSNYSSTYGLSDGYWSSSQYSASNAWDVIFGREAFCDDYVSLDGYVRLSATF